MLRLTLAAVLLVAAVPAVAQDRAVIVGNENYSDGADITEADAALDAAAPLQAAGFAVASGRDLETGGIRALLSPLVRDAPETGRLVIVLSGHFAQSAGNTWFLGVEASMPDLATIDGVGVPLSTVLEVAAQAPGGAVVMLGTEARRLPLGPGLDAGIGAVTVPQGVTLVRGDAARVADFAATALPLRGQPLAAMLDANPDLTADGFVSALVPFRPASDTAAVDPLPGPDAEAVFWESTTEQGTLGAYEAYVKRYPKGRYLADAQAEVARIKAEPARAARAAEEALALGRDDRRAIQRGLTLVGFDTKGIDGVFGAGSRSAITGWQRKNGYEATGYVTREQIVKLAEQADARSSALEAEAAERQRATEAADRAYWQQSGAAGDEAGLRAYLAKYPDGLYADLAEERLAEIEKARQGEAAAAERAAWDRATQAQTVAAYRAYLQAYPQGAFAAEARARIGALVADTGGQVAEWQAAETALGLGTGGRRAIEGRLDVLELKPGTVDGVFDDRSRRAIRRFQESRAMEPTGYLDQTTTVALLAGAVLRLGD